MKARKDDFLSQIVGFVSPGGAYSDPKGKRGLSSTVIQNYRYGSKSLDSYEKLFAQLESIGAVLINDNGYESSSLFVSVPSENIAKAEAIIRELYLHPLDRAEDVDKTINNLKLSIDNTKSSDLQAALARFKENVSGVGLIDGDKSELDSIKRDDLASYRDSFFKKPIFLSVKSLSNYQIDGDTNMDSLEVLHIPDQSNKFEFIPKDIEQKVIVLGFETDAEAAYDYYVRNVALRIVSGSWSSFAFDRIREKESAAYYAAGRHDLYNHAGMFYMFAGVSEQNIVKCTGLMAEILDDVQAGNFDEDLLEIAKKTFISGIEQTFDSLNGITGFIAYRALRGRPIPDYKEIVLKTEQVTKEDVISFYRTLCKNRKLSLVVNGNISNQNQNELTKLVESWKSHD